MREETDETTFWLEIIEESHLLDNERIKVLKRETKEILSIIVASIKTMKSKVQNPES